MCGFFTLSRSPVLCRHQLGQFNPGTNCFPWWLRWLRICLQPGDPGLTPESGRFPGDGNGDPLGYSCLENSMDREAWWATVHGVTKSQIQLSIWHTHQLPGFLLSREDTTRRWSSINQQASSLQISNLPAPWSQTFQSPEMGEINYWPVQRIL